MVCKLCFQNKTGLMTVDAATVAPILKTTPPVTVKEIEQILFQSASMRKLKLYSEAADYEVYFTKFLSQYSPQSVLQNFFRLPVINQAALLQLTPEYRYFCQALLLYGQTTINFVLNQFQKSALTANHALLAAEILFQTQDPLLYLQTLSQEEQFFDVRYIREGLLKSVKKLGQEQHPTYNYWLKEINRLLEPSPKVIVENDFFDLTQLPENKIPLLEEMLNNSKYQEAFALTFAAPLSEQSVLIQKIITILEKKASHVNSERREVIRFLEDATKIKEILALLNNSPQGNGHFAQRIKKIYDFSFLISPPPQVWSLIEHITPSLMTKIFLQKAIENVKHPQNYTSDLFLTQTVAEKLELRHLNDPENTLRVYWQSLPAGEKKYNFGLACYNFWQRQQQPAKGLAFLTAAIQTQLTFITENPKKTPFSLKIKGLAEPLIKAEIEQNYQQWLQEQQPTLTKDIRKMTTAYFWTLAVLSQNQNLMNQITANSDFQPDYLWMAAAANDAAYQTMWLKLKESPPLNNKTKHPATFYQKFLDKAETPSFLKQFNVAQRTEIMNFLWQKSKAEGLSPELKKCLWRTEIPQKELAKLAFQELDGEDGSSKVIAVAYLMAVAQQKIKKMTENL